VIIPLTILLIGVLLYINFASLTDTLLGSAVIPMAMIGGIFALFLTGTPFSVSAAIGFIALFGIAVMEGIILLSYFNQLIDRGTGRDAAIMQACQTRFRPVMMTCIAACVGLLPAAVSTAIGAQVPACSGSRGRHPAHAYPRARDLAGAYRPVFEANPAGHSRSKSRGTC
jgi:heavy metal efflux system protein